MQIVTRLFEMLWKILVKCLENVQLKFKECSLNDWRVTERIEDKNYKRLEIKLNKNSECSRNVRMRLFVSTHNMFVFLKMFGDCSQTRMIVEFFKIVHNIIKYVQKMFAECFKCVQILLTD